MRIGGSESRLACPACKTQKENRNPLLSPSLVLSRQPCRLSSHLTRPIPLLSLAYYSFLTFFPLPSLFFFYLTTSNLLSISRTPPIFFDDWRDSCLAITLPLSSLISGVPFPSLSRSSRDPQKAKTSKKEGATQITPPPPKTTTTDQLYSS